MKRIINSNIFKFILVFFALLIVGFVTLSGKNQFFNFIKLMALQGKYGSMISEGRNIDNKYIEYKGSIYKYTSGEFYEVSSKMTSDVINFQSLDGLYSKDSSNYFFNSNRIKDIDYSSFEVLSEVYAKDKQNVYYSGKVLINSDPNDFEFIDEDKDLTRSGKYVYIQEKIAPNINGNKIEYLENTSFFKDDDTLIQFNSYIDGRGSKHIDNSYFKEISGVDVGKFGILDSESEYKKVGYKYVPTRCGDGSIILDCTTGKKLN
jgi:hypothetical protein